MKVSAAAVATPAPSVARSRAALAVEPVRDRKLSVGAISAAGFASAADLMEVVARQFNLPRLELDGLELAATLADLLPREVAERHGIVAVFASPQEVSVATSDPTRIELADWLAGQLKRAVSFVVATPAEVERAIRRLYDPQVAASRIDAEAETVSHEALLAATPIVNSAIAGALEQHASDIHIEATEREITIRYRVDGALRTVATHSIDLHAAVVSRIKVLANLDIAIRQVPQDGRIKIKHGHADIDLRVSVLPTYWGEKVVCRVLDNRRAALPLDELAFSPDERACFDRMIKSPYGLVLVTGPTGSGKSTTLYAALNSVRSSELNVVTVEDPVEYQLAGINQVQVNAKRGLTFAGALRSILRQDPDVILVGEIRDHETGVVAAEAALTGHLVLSSLHTNDAISAVTRLTEMGVEPHLIAPSLVGVVAQRLVRRVCTECTEPHIPDAAETTALGLPPLPAGFHLVRGRGCAACHRTGYRGRIAIRELLEIDDTMRALISRSANVDELRAHAAATGFRPMRIAALRLLIGRATSAREVLRVTRS